MRACVERAIASGDLPPDTNAAAPAGVFDTILAGLSVQARDSMPAEALDTAISSLMLVWDKTATGKRDALLME